MVHVLELVQRLPLYAMEIPSSGRKKLIYKGKPQAMLALRGPAHGWGASARFIASRPPERRRSSPSWKAPG